MPAPTQSQPSSDLPPRLVRGTYTKKYTCDCSRYCKKLRTVSAKSFNRHRPHRRTPDEDLIIYLDRYTGTPVIGKPMAPISGPDPSGSGAAAASTDSGPPATPPATQPGRPTSGTIPGSSTARRQDEMEENDTDYYDMPALDPISDDEDEDADEEAGADEQEEEDEEDDEEAGNGSGMEDSSLTGEEQTHSRTPALSRTSSLSRGGGLSRAPSLHHTPPSTQPRAPLPPISEDDMDVDQIDPPPEEENEQEEDEEPEADGEGSDSDKEPEVGYSEDQGAPSKAKRTEFRDAEAFIEPLRSASLDSSGLDKDTLDRLRSPPRDVPELSGADRAGVRMYLARGDASEENYSDNRAAFMELHPDDPIPTYDQVKQLVANLTGVTALRTDMCEDTCVAFTGPFEEYLECPKCGKGRYDPAELVRGRRVPRRTFYTFPIGPQLQAMWASPENARLMQHRRHGTEKIQAEVAASGGNISALQDVYYGSAYLDRAQNKRDTPAQAEKKPIGPDDMILMFSIDGAQLYASKASDCWFYVWILFDLPPNARYKKRYVLPGAVIGGPKKPKNVDSFLFPGIYHLSAIQREGLQIWDGAEERMFKSYVYLFLVTADSPAMAYLNGLVGHSGAHGCRLYCGQRGRHKPGQSTYYPALYRYGPEDDGPPNISPRAPDNAAERPVIYQAKLATVRATRTNKDYAAARLATGIGKPSIFSGLPAERFLGVPHGFVLDLMHLISLNIPDLLIRLFRGTLTCEEPDSVDSWDFAIFRTKKAWKAHGKLVASCARYLPGSFDRPPRDPAKKISSGYKAWEFLLYVYGLLPGLLRGFLPEKYYQHFCRLVAGVRIVLQMRLPLAQLPTAHRHFVKYAEGMEELYYKGRAERLHFVRPSIHTLLHIVPEALRIGPGGLHSQWTLENFIGNITREIKQHVTPYANVSERAYRRCQVNALKAKIPAFADPLEPSIPATGIDLGDGYALLRAADRVERNVSASEAEAVNVFLAQQHVQLEDPNWVPIVLRWARAAIPTGQVGRSGWKEEHREAKGRQPRRARMVKLRGDRFAEVQYYFQFRYDKQDHALAMVAPFTAPDPDILAYSLNTVLACTHPGDGVREVIFITEIISVVAMVPLPMTPAEAQERDAVRRYANRFFVVEKPGLDIAYMAGRVDDPNIDADDFNVD